MPARTVIGRSSSAVAISCGGGRRRNSPSGYPNPTSSALATVDSAASHPPAGYRLADYAAQIRPPRSSRPSVGGRGRWRYQWARDRHRSFSRLLPSDPPERHTFMCRFAPIAAAIAISPSLPVGRFDRPLSGGDGLGMPGSARPDRSTALLRRRTPTHLPAEPLARLIATARQWFPLAEAMS